ncbi:hypothetical protein B0H13DRAFT_2413678 [Mycena leptocephala]|nr:hypothetical protein B0H13DRAFT_2413678 [Mycena leptocephala]
MDVYDATLPAWRAAVRRVLVAQIRIESVLVAKMQDAIRTPFLDKYFVHTSALGSHTFFMTFLPMLSSSGTLSWAEVVLCLGIYFTSVAKDLFCSPRPFAPPVTRMNLQQSAHTIWNTGCHRRHSANSVSLALFFFAHIHELAFPSTPPPRPLPSCIRRAHHLPRGVRHLHRLRAPLHRVHSFSDCAVGVFLGAIIWLAHTSFPGFLLTIPLPSALAAAPYTYTATLFLAGAGAHSLRPGSCARPPHPRPAHAHPARAPRCEPAPAAGGRLPVLRGRIAIGSVMLGSLVGRWALCGGARTSPARAW